MSTLPRDALVIVFANLSSADGLRCCAVSTSWRSAIYSDDALAHTLLNFCRVRFALGADGRDFSPNNVPILSVGREPLGGGVADPTLFEKRRGHVSVPSFDMCTTDFTVHARVKMNAMALPVGMATPMFPVFADWHKPWKFMFSVSSSGPYGELRRNIDSRGSDPAQGLVSVSGGGIPLVPGRWHDVTWVWHRATKTLRSYVDGVAADTKSTSYPDITLQRNNHKEYVIGWKNDDTLRFEGHIPCVVVMVRALTARGVARLAQSHGDYRVLTMEEELFES